MSISTAQADLASVAQSEHTTRTSRAPPQLLVPLASLHVAAKHNTVLKLKLMLDQPELAASVRAELVPNRLRLHDLFCIVEWFPARTWKGLGLFGVAKYSTLYSWVLLLAPDSVAFQTCWR